MPKNKIVGKKNSKGTNKASGRKYTEADLRSNRKNQKKRVQLNREARKKGVYGKRYKKGVDLSHGKGGLKLESRSKNRSRNGKGGRKRTR